MGPIHKPLNTCNEEQARLEPPSLPDANLQWAVLKPQLSTGTAGTGLAHKELLLCLATQRKLKHPAFLQLMRIVSRLGDGVAWYALIAMIALSGADQSQRAAVLMLAVGAVSLVLYKGLKKATSRKRPYVRDGQVVALTAALDEFSFPSGHTLHAVAFTTVACAYFPMLVWLLVPFTALIALSRVVLGLHYPSDVLAGAGLGVSLAATSLLCAAQAA